MFGEKIRFKIKRELKAGMFPHNHPTVQRRRARLLRADRKDAERLHPWRSSRGRGHLPVGPWFDPQLL